MSQDPAPYLYGQAVTVDPEAMIADGAEFMEALRAAEQRYFLATYGPRKQFRRMVVTVDHADPGSDRTVGIMAVDGVIQEYSFTFGIHRAPEQPTCRACHQTADHFFTSQRDQSVLCETCFQGRETKGLAKEVKKTKHPLDAWMEG